MISEAFLLAKIPVTAQATAVMGLERVVAVVATKVAQVMDLRAVVAMDLALDPRAVMGLPAVVIMVEVMDQAVMVPHMKVAQAQARLAAMGLLAVAVMVEVMDQAQARLAAMGLPAVAIMVEVMDQAVMVPHMKVDQAQARLVVMDPQAVVAMEVLAAAEAAQTETMEAMVVVAPVAVRTVEVAVMGLEPVGAMDMVQLAVLAAAAMEQADLPAAVATEQVQMAVEVMDPVAATIKAIRCQTRFSPKAVIFLTSDNWTLLVDIVVEVIDCTFGLVQKSVKSVANTMSRSMRRKRSRKDCAKV